MLNRIMTMALAASFLCACGETDVNIIASVQWSLNYGDWTNTNAGADNDDLRDCSNQPDGRYAGIDENPYPKITKVRVFIEDPLGQVPNSDREYDCEMGFGAKKIDIKSMVRQNYDITVEAKDASGQVLYRHKEIDVDLSVVATHSYELKAVTSETTFFPRYGGSHECPEGISKLRYSFYTDEAKNAADGEASYVGFAPTPCSSGISNVIYARGTPVDPQMGSNEQYNPTMYTIKVEALDDNDTVSHCGWDNTKRAFRPGSNENGNRSGDINVVSGTCN